MHTDRKCWWNKQSLFTILWMRLKKYTDRSNIISVVLQHRIHKHAAAMLVVNFTNMVWRHLGILIFNKVPWNLRSYEEQYISACIDASPFANCSKHLSFQVGFILSAGLLGFKFYWIKQSAAWTVHHLMVWWPTSQKTIRWEMEGSGCGLTWSMMLSFTWNGWWKTTKIVSQAS